MLPNLPTLIHKTSAQSQKYSKQKVGFHVLGCLQINECISDNDTTYLEGTYNHYYVGWGKREIQELNHCTPHSPCFPHTHTWGQGRRLVWFWGGDLCYDLLSHRHQFSCSNSGHKMKFTALETLLNSLVHGTVHTTTQKKPIFVQFKFNFHKAVMCSTEK